MISLNILSSGILYQPILFHLLLQNLLHELCYSILHRRSGIIFVDVFNTCLHKVYTLYPPCFRTTGFIWRCHRLLGPTRRRSLQLCGTRGQHLHVPRGDLSQRDTVVRPTESPRLPEGRTHVRRDAVRNHGPVHFSDGQEGARTAHRLQVCLSHKDQSSVAFFSSMH